MAVMVGFGFTVIAIVVVLEQTPFEPVTVYVVLVAGVTVTFEPINAPGFQVYVVAPLAVNVVEFPAQIDKLLAVAFTVGIGVTIKFTVLVVVHPKPLAPVTVYRVVAAGETVIVPPVNAPGFQV